MRIHASIDFNVDTIDMSDKYKADVAAFYERPTTANFRSVLKIMSNAPVDVAYDDNITYRVSLNEDNIDRQVTVHFETESSDSEVVEVCNHCDNEVNSDEYNSVHN